MVATLCLIGCVLAPAQAVSGSADWLLTPRFSRAQELVYRGTYSEEASGKGVQYTRAYRLESRLFVLDATAQGAELALFTKLVMRAAPLARPNEPQASTDSGSVRLEQARINARGRVASESGASLLVSLTGPPTLECGALVEVPNGRVGLNHSWEVAEDGRPPLTWTVAGSETVNGTSCVKLVGLQQSEDWERPRADRTAWRRQESVWLSPRQGIACRVERTLEQREPARREPTQRSVVRYELESSLVYPAQLMDDRHREIAHYRSVSENATPLLREPGKFGPAPHDAVLTRINHYLDTQPPTPYREALLHLKKRVEAARRGQGTPAVADHGQAVAVAALGQIAPDFVMQGLVTKESIRLHRLFGRPILLVFYNPTSHTAEELLRFAQSLHETNKDVTVLGLAFSEDSDAVVQQYTDLKLGFPLLPGKGLRLTYAVDATPKLVILDAGGVVRGSYVGWGREIPGAVVEELKRCKR